MYKILIFGGTTEGRILAEFCSAEGIPAVVSVTTAYGAELLQDCTGLKILTGKLDASGMESVMRQYGISLVVDATHPYAIEATRQIQLACNTMQVRYIRVLREESEAGTYGQYVPDMAAAVAYLSEHPDGNILITTGSKELHQFCVLAHCAERCTARILPTAEMLAACQALGFPETHIIAEKGPFSEKQNLAHLESCNASYLVTKESGSVGGFLAKVRAAQAYGAELVIIRRPEEQGVSISEAEQVLRMEGMA